MEFKREMSDLPKVRRLKEALLLTTCFVVVVLDFFFWPTYNHVSFPSNETLSLVCSSIETPKKNNKPKRDWDCEQRIDSMSNGETTY